MERCTLCGARLHGIKCRECGWDNSKNDNRYYLNKHNEQGSKFHSGACEDDLNQSKKKVVPNKPGNHTIQNNVPKTNVSKTPAAKGKTVAQAPKKSGNLLLYVFYILVLFSILSGFLIPFLEEF